TACSMGPAVTSTARRARSTAPNMLAGLCLQPGAWMPTEGLLDDVKVSDVVMHDVTTPLHLSVKPGNTAGRVWVDRLTATGVNLAAASLESWAETPIGRVCLRDVSLEFTGGGVIDPARTEVLAPGVDARPLPALWDKIPILSSFVSMKRQDWNLVPRCSGNRPGSAVQAQVGGQEVLGDVQVAGGVGMEGAVLVTLHLV